MKKTLIFSLSTINNAGFYNDLMKELSKRDLLKGRNLQLPFKREVDNFDLPIGGFCSLQYSTNPNRQLVLSVDNYFSEINRDFSQQDSFVYLKFANFVNFNAKEVADYLEAEWT